MEGDSAFRIGALVMVGWRGVMFPRNGVVRVEIARGETCGAKEVEGEGSTTVVISELGVGDKALDSGGHGVGLGKNVVVAGEGKGSIGGSCFPVLE